MRKMITHPIYKDKLDSNQAYAGSAGSSGHALIKDLFLNDITRNIKAVINANENSDKTEIEEELRDFVITDELSGQLDDFLSAYNDYDKANGNGVWISGFFGSGKSHLLKMLSFVLANNLDINGHKPLELFLENNGENAQDLKPLLDRAVRAYPSESILFNVQSWENVVAKDNNPLLTSFMQVFNQHCGYCNGSLFIAEFERNLDEQGKLDIFKQKFHELTGKDWNEERASNIFLDMPVNKVLLELGLIESDKDNFFASSKKNYTFNINVFVSTVKKYIDKKKKEFGVGNFRLNFFVDEIGQYIADNTKLMLSLQTISENLTRECGADSWLLVTAQDSMDEIIGRDQDQKIGNDFSKIQDRFRIRLKLTSKNVKEVISKRLLAKTDQAKTDLAKIWNDKHDNFKTIFEFSDNNRKYDTFRDEDDFIDLYPFIPYQFSVFQDSIKALSASGLLEGKNESVGERSMLGAFHHVLLNNANKEIGAITSFDEMFECIKQKLKHSYISTLISFQQSNENKIRAKDPLTILELRLLKILLFVRYTTGFMTNPVNLGKAG